jgi:alkane 1-monooxygenase
LYTALTLWLGWGALLVLLLHVPIVWWQLTSANYIEHYGLLRQKLSNGQYERCQPKHSWNSNHLISNLVLFHLQRHSDHHANPSRHYQSLRHFEEAPQLPTGYMGMFLLAYVPPLWYRVMDQRLLDLHQNDRTQLNSLTG